jgi:Fe-S cluster assembly iron-binding protein IscA
MGSGALVGQFDSTEESSLNLLDKPCPVVFGLELYMVIVTESAKEELSRVLETKNPDSGKLLRLAVPPVWTGEGDFGIVIDEPASDDHETDFNGRKVLLVGADLLEQLSDSVLDFKEFPDGPRFTLDVY